MGVIFGTGSGPAARSNQLFTLSGNLQICRSLHTGGGSVAACLPILLLCTREFSPSRVCKSCTFLFTPLLPLQQLCMFLPLLAAKIRGLFPVVFGHICRRKSFSPNHQDQIGTCKHVYINTYSFVLNESSPCKRQQGACFRLLIGQRLNACQVNFHVH